MVGPHRPLVRPVLCPSVRPVNIAVLFAILFLAPPRLRGHCDRVSRGDDINAAADGGTARRGRGRAAGRAGRRRASSGERGRWAPLRSSPRWPDCTAVGAQWRRSRGAIEAAASGEGRADMRSRVGGLAGRRRSRGGGSSSRSNRSNRTCSGVASAARRRRPCVPPAALAASLPQPEHCRRGHENGSGSGGASEQSARAPLRLQSFGLSGRSGRLGSAHHHTRHLHHGRTGRRRSAAQYKQRRNGPGRNHERVGPTKPSARAAPPSFPSRGHCARGAATRGHRSIDRLARSAGRRRARHTAPVWARMRE